MQTLIENFDARKSKKYVLDYGFGKCGFGFYVYDKSGLRVIIFIKDQYLCKH